jgi:hypothetical protein
MEHREPSVIAPGDRRFDEAVEKPSGPFELRRFEPAPDRRHADFGRAGLLILFALAVVAGVMYLAIHLTRAALDWLHHQPKYQVPFSKIELATPPPAWYRGGTPVFLERVRRGAGAPERIALLAPERLTQAFKSYPWVERVVKVAYLPGRIVVDLRYYRPVGWVNLPGGEQQIVDEKGTLLSLEDVDLQELGRVIKISGAGLTAPAEPRAGVVWKSNASGTGLGEDDPRIRAAAKLAGFLLTEARVREGRGAPALQIVEIITIDVPNQHSFGLYVMNAEETPIWWRSAPGEEVPGEPSAEEKWTMLLQWQRTTSARRLAAEDSWAFSKNGLFHRCPHHPKSPHQPREDAETGKNRPTGRKTGRPG